MIVVIVYGILAICALAFVVALTVGFVLVVFDEVQDTVDWWKTRRYWREKGRETARENRDKRIAKLERELGITDTWRNT